MTTRYTPNINKADHKKLAAWFLGPKAENEKEFLELIATALNDHAVWRKAYYPTDPAYIDEDMKKSVPYQQQMLRIKQELSILNDRMHNSLPTFSSRYKGHMNWEVSMIGLLGYFAAMLYNQNNVATEASAVTTAIEQEVGDDLCKMLQFRSHWAGFSKDEYPLAWGHLTSCGSAANFEGAWAARNVKYLAYQVRRAIDDPKGAVGKDLTVTQANGTTDLLRNISPDTPDGQWVLLNVPANNSLDLLHRFAALLGGLDTALSLIAPFGVQRAGVVNMPGGTPRYLVPATAHYSWAKAGALIGIGENAMERVAVDAHGRLDVTKLEASLRAYATAKTPVLLSVAILGSTTEGAMDPIKDVADLREKLRKELNFDFNLHADAAWGGYCCSMLYPPVPPAPSSSLGVVPASKSTYTPVTPLNDHVRTNLANIYRADTITLDPHKAGYIQYPAGSICFQNKRMRDMLAYKAPYITPTGGDFEDPTVGTYGIDGSRAGAAAVATYLHHRVTGLGPDGHGMLVGQANFNAKQFWALLATMAAPNDPFIIGQLDQPTAAEIELLKVGLSLPNDELVYNVPIMELLQKRGPDFLINTFAVNYSYPVIVFDGATRTPNKDIAQSMALMSAIGSQLNTPYAQIHPDTTRPKGVSRKGLFLIRDTLYTTTYAQAITALTKIVGVDYEATDEYPEYSMLVSTNMEPWSSAKGFLDVFRSELRQAILRAIGELHDTPALHSFVVVDALDAEVFGENISTFANPTHQYQSILKFEFGDVEPLTNVIVGNESVKYGLFSQYRALVAAGPYKPLVLTTKKAETINDLIYRADDDLWFDADFKYGVDGQALGTYKVRVSDVLLHNHFDNAAVYPANENYFIFGANDNVYASHLITKHPNYQHLIQIQHPPPGVSELLLELGVEATLVGVNTDDNRTANPLQVGFSYALELVRENSEAHASSLTVKSDIWFDEATLNTKPSQAQAAQPAKPAHPVRKPHAHRHAPRPRPLHEIHARLGAPRALDAVLPAFSAPPAFVAPAASASPAHSGVGAIFRAF